MASITRTFKTTIVEFLAMNLETNEATIDTFNLAESIYGENKEEKILKKIRKAKDTDTYKVVAIRDIKVVEELREMSVQEFYDNSRPAPEEQAKREARKAQQK